MKYKKVVWGLLSLVFIGDILLVLQVHTAVNRILIKLNRDEFKTLIVPVFADSRFYLVLFGFWKTKATEAYIKELKEFQESYFK